jgi:hypothetical protein
VTEIYYTTSSCNWLVTLNGAKSRLLKSLIRAAKRIYVQQVMLQQKIHELGKKTKTQKRKKKKEGGSRRLNNPSLISWWTSSLSMDLYW